MKNSNLVKEGEKWNKNVVTCIRCGVHWAKPGKQCQVCYTPIPEMSVEAIKYLCELEEQVKQKSFEEGERLAIQRIRNFNFGDLGVALKKEIKRELDKAREEGKREMVEKIKKMIGKDVKEDSGLVIDSYDKGFVFAVNYLKKQLRTKLQMLKKK